MNSRRETFPFAASDFIFSRSVIEYSSTVPELFCLALHNYDGAGFTPLVVQTRQPRFTLFSEPGKFVH
jgi:hypothetical protein